MCYSALGQLDLALSLCEETIRIQRATIGPKHPETQRTLGNIGTIYKDLGDQEKAIPCLEEAYATSKEHPKLRWIGPHLVEAYAKARKLTEARKLTKELIENERKVKASNSRNLTVLLATLSISLLEANEFVEAETLLRECLSLRLRDQPEDWRTFSTQSLLGDALLGQGKYEDAEKLLRDGYEGMVARRKTMSSRGQIRISEALDRLVKFYSETGNLNEKERWISERAKFSSSKDEDNK